MEPLSSFKRKKDETDYEKCIICQADNSDKIRSGTSLGAATLRQCAQERLKKKDNVNRDAIDRILSSVRDNMCYHNGCYSTFTSKTIISRLKTTEVSQCSAEFSVKTLRSSTETIDWTKCLFLSGGEGGGYTLRTVF